MDHTNHIRLTPAELTSDTLHGAPIYGAGDHKIGHVSHVHGAGADALVAIDVGGFLGIGAKHVGVPATSLDFMRDEAGDVHAHTTWTKEELEAMPHHEDFGGAFI